jgi:hypothetical protein
MSDPKRLRAQAELQSLYNQLANLREREADYFQTVSGVPNWLTNKIGETRQEIARLEGEELALDESAVEASSANRFYREAYALELAGDLVKAERLYKQAARHNHPDADAARRSVRQRRKGKSVTRVTRNRYVVSLVVLFIVAGVILLLGNNRGNPTGGPKQEATTDMPAATFTPPVVVLVTSTPTLIPTPTNTPKATALSVSTDTPQPRPTEVLPTDTPAPTPTPTPPPPLRPAPKMIGPRDNLVWQGGAVVFYFEKLDLAEDELYCLDTLRGYDRTLTENWSKAPVGSKDPSIAVEANAFEVAQTQGMQCITWSAYIGQGTCENIISGKTELRIIGLPDPCEF